MLGKGVILELASKRAARKFVPGMFT